MVAVSTDLTRITFISRKWYLCNRLKLSSWLLVLLILISYFTNVCLLPIKVSKYHGNETILPVLTDADHSLTDKVDSSVIKLRPDELQPPDHLDAVKMEQDGHLNHEYLKEVFLGNHEQLEGRTELDVTSTLRDIFHKVDTSHDELISASELEVWIALKIQEHFDETNDENEKIFNSLDSDKDGFITWHEFFVQFLIAKGHGADDSEKHAADYETINMDDKEKDLLIKNKFRWSEADEDPQDNKLNINEFKNFRHPEQSSSMLSAMVSDILSNLDRDRDGLLKEEEFIALPPGEAEGQSDWLQQEKLWQEERRKEFKNIIDLDKDGKVTKEELKNYVDPMNPSHARMEVQNLLELADNNKDNHLSLEEILNNKDLFMGSKMVNAGKNFHDEF